MPGSHILSEKLISIGNWWIMDYICHLSWHEFVTKGAVDLDSNREALEGVLLMQKTIEGDMKKRLLKLVRLICALSDGMQYNLRYTEDKDTTVLEHALQIYDSLFAGESLNVSQEKIAQMRDRLKAQAVVVCCAKNDFTKAQIVAKRIDNSESGMLENSAVQNILQEGRFDDSDAQKYLYKNFLDQMILLLSDVYNSLPKPFIITSAEMLLARQHMTEAASESSDNVAESTKIKELHVQKLGNDDRLKKSSGVEKGGASERTNWENITTEIWENAYLVPFSDGAVTQETSCNIQQTTEAYCSAENQKNEVSDVNVQLENEPGFVERIRARRIFLSSSVRKKALSYLQKKCLNASMPNATPTPSTSKSTAVPKIKKLVLDSQQNIFSTEKKMSCERNASSEKDGKFVEVPHHKVMLRVKRKGHKALHLPNIYGDDRKTCKNYGAGYGEFEIKTTDCNTESNSIKENVNGEIVEVSSTTTNRSSSAVKVNSTLGQQSKICRKRSPEANIQKSYKTLFDASNAPLFTSCSPQSTSTSEDEHDREILTKSKELPLELLEDIRDGVVSDTQSSSEDIKQINSNSTTANCKNKKRKAPSESDVENVSYHSSTHNGSIAEVQVGNGGNVKNQNLNSLPKNRIDKMKRKKDKCKPKRVRNEWLLSEERNLYLAVNKHGVGNWANIVESGQFHNRNNVHLKDKWRNMVKSGAVKKFEKLIHHANSNN